MYFALALTGPTASGKTALSVKLAEALSLEIISLDSMQIYNGMDIGTAKVKQEEMLGVRHHLIDFLDPREQYSTENYRTDAMRAVEDITSRGSLALFVGGTGLYLDTLTRTSSLAPESDAEWFDKMLSGIKTDSDKEALWNKLYEVDREAAENIHKNNVRRVLRALEIYEKTGRTKTYFDNLSKKGRPDIKIGHITLDFHNRDNLYSRVDKRVDIMLKEGRVEEVRTLYENGSLSPDTTASQAIGYKEMLAYIKGEGTLSEAAELIKLSSRRYAKRQLTWFRAKDAVKVYLDRDNGEMRDFDEVFSEIRCIAMKMINDNITERNTK